MLSTLVIRSASHMCCEFVKLYHVQTNVGQAQEHPNIGRTHLYQVELAQSNSTLLKLQDKLRVTKRKVAHLLRVTGFKSKKVKWASGIPPGKPTKPHAKSKRVSIKATKRACLLSSKSTRAYVNTGTGEVILLY